MASGGGIFERSVDPESGPSQMEIALLQGETQENSLLLGSLPREDTR